jgi:ATP-dependent Lhr-like helicase
MASLGGAGEGCTEGLATRSSGRPRYWGTPAAIRSVNQLAERARDDAGFLEIGALYTGRPDFDVARLVADLAEPEAVPFLSVLRYSEDGSVETSDATALLRHMKLTSVLADDQGILGIGPAGEETLGRRNFIELMSAFTTPLLISVRCGNTELGEVAPTTLASSKEKPTTLLLRGRSWRVTGVDWKKRLAWVEPSQDGGKSQWPGSSRFMSYALCRAVERTLVSREPSATISNRAREQFEHLCEEHAFCDGSSMPLLVDESGRAKLLTFAGAAVNGPVSRALKARNVDVARYDNFSVFITTGDASTVSRLLGNLTPSDCDFLVPRDVDNALKFSVCLPPGQVAAILSERCRDEQGLVETLKRPVRIVRADG